MTHQSVGLYSTNVVQRMHAVENLRMSYPECPLLVLKFNHQNE